MIDEKAMKEMLPFQDVAANEAAVKIVHDQFYAMFEDMLVHEEPLTPTEAIFFGAYMLELGMEVQKHFDDVPCESGISN